MAVIDRATRLLAHKGINIKNKEELISKLTEYTKENGYPFTCSSFGHECAMAVKSLYPDDIVVIDKGVNKGITTNKGMDFLEQLKKQQKSFCERNKTIGKTFTVSLPCSLRKDIRTFSRELKEKYKMDIPLCMALQEMIRLGCCNRLHGGEFVDQGGQQDDGRTV